jgi:hypothetical protein
MGSDGQGGVVGGLLPSFEDRAGAFLILLIGLNGLVGLVG